MLHHKNAILIAPNFATHCGVRRVHRQQGARSEASAVRWNDLICVNDKVANWVAFFLILFKMININFII